MKRDTIECFSCPTYFLSPPLFPSLAAWPRRLRFSDRVNYLYRIGSIRKHAFKLKFNLNKLSSQLYSYKTESCSFAYSETFIRQILLYMIIGFLHKQLYYTLDLMYNP